MAHSKTNWQNKGFGWIPDLPDVTDPNIASIAQEHNRIQTQELTGYVEAVAEQQVGALQDRVAIDPEKAKALNRALFGNTRFPQVSIYKILRKGADLQSQDVLRLRQALYFIYRKEKTKSDEPTKANAQWINILDNIFSQAGSQPFQWLQNSTFTDELEEIVIYFQEWAELVGDGIVGIRTYATLQAFLEDREIIEQESLLLCPPSLVPREALKESFKRLTYIWLNDKFQRKFKKSLLKFCKKYPNDVISQEKIQSICQSLQNDIENSLSSIVTAFRDEIDDNKTSTHKHSTEERTDRAFKHLKKLSHDHLEGFYDGLIKKLQKLIIENFEIEELEEGNVGDITDLWEAKVKELQVYAKDHNITLLSSENINQLIEELLIPDGNFSFTLYSNDDFIRQFELWFNIIEPFISAILQATSPLASFDNLQDAVKTGFDRIDSSFQLNHLENRTPLNTYKSLVSEYSSSHLSDALEELRTLKQSATVLFEETLTKICRTEADDLNFRRDIIDSLIEGLEALEVSHTEPQSFLLAPIQPNREAFLERVRIKVSSRYDDIKWHSTIKPAAIEFFNARIKKPSEFLKIEALTDEKQDVQLFLDFFRFLKEIIVNHYKIDLPTFLGQESQSSRRQQASLMSLVSTKKELFEIQFNEQPNESLNSAPISFLQPVSLQLPVNANLLESLPKDKNSNIRTYFFLPGVVDLSYWCSPVRDQGSRNACTAFAGTAMVEYFAQKRYGRYITLSPRFLYKIARNLMHRSDDLGASVRQTMKALVLFGVPPEDTWAWCENDVDQELPAYCYAYAQSYQALKYFRLDSMALSQQVRSERAILDSQELLLFQVKAVLAAGLPCMFGFTIYSSCYKDSNIRRGYIPFPSDRDKVIGGHAAVAIGYNDYKVIERLDGKSAQPGAILIRNSWGPEWGNGGYGWLPYEYILQGLTSDWWSLLQSEWFDDGAFGLGAIDPGRPVIKPNH